MNAFQAALLGIIQGLTEFLPVSSSAHLILARAFFGWELGVNVLAFDVACHVGTLGAVLTFFRREIVTMIAVAPVVARDSTSDAAKLLRMILIGTIPIIIVGLGAADRITASWRTPEVAGVALALGGVLMMVAEQTKSGDRSEGALTWSEALLLGIAQAAALVPGVSRAGAVLTVGIMLGLRRDRAATFSFLLGIPAVLAASGRAALELVGQGLQPGMLQPFVVGIVTSAVVGYLTVKCFIFYVTRYSLNVFAIYRLGLAVAVLLWVVQGRSPV